VSAPYTSREVARLVGRSVDRLLRSIDALNARHGMPRPLAGRPYRWDRATFDLWRTGRALRAAANDPLPMPRDDDAARAALHQVYGRRTA
jgi:hypothetical protein